MNKNLKIGIDIDEIITEYMRSFLEFLKEEKEIFINYNEILDYNHVAKSKGFTQEQIQKYVQEHTSKDITLLDLNLIEGSLEAINFLDNSYEICFITSRHISNEKNTIKFFKKHFQDKDFKIIFSGDAWGGNKSKSEICEELGIKIFIEDNPNYALSCAKKGIKTFLLDKPWNQGVEHKNIIRVQNWKELLERLG